MLTVDDGSRDNTAEVARELALAYPSVHLVVLHENGGPAKARNAGLDLAREEWVVVLDADDAFMPERLERASGGGKFGNGSVSRASQSEKWPPAKRPPAAKNKGLAQDSGRADGQPSLAEAGTGLPRTPERLRY